jgi:sulfatase modifying factor 1
VVVWQRVKRALLLLLCAGSTGCGLAESGLANRGADGGDDVTVLPLDGGEAADASDASTDADAGACPTGLEGPAMAPVSEYCVDSTEVTVAQYGKFVAVDGGFVMDPRCDWKSDYVPSDWSSQSNPSNPVVEVDWCDAFEYCQWAKKSLCGDRQGGAVDWSANPVDPAVGRWFNACSLGGTQTYAYGDTWDSQRCNDDNNNSGVVAVGSYDQCEGGYAKLFDMTGNAAEWIDHCDDSGDPRNDTCHVIGGDWGSSDNEARCFDTATHSRNNDSDDGIGFRCCWP